MTKEDVEDASGEGEQKCWFGEKGAMNRARWSWRNCWQSGANPANFNCSIINIYFIQGLVFENARRAMNYPPGVAQAC